MLIIFNEFLCKANYQDYSHNKTKHRSKKCALIPLMELILNTFSYLLHYSLIDVQKLLKFCYTIKNFYLFDLTRHVLDIIYALLLTSICVNINGLLPCGIIEDNALYHIILFPGCTWLWRSM